MKRTTLLLTLLAVLLVPSMAAADFSIFGSYIDTSDFGQSWGGGLRFAAGGKVQFEGTVTYYDDLKGVIHTTMIPTTLGALPVDIGVRFNPGEGLFYVAGGGSYYFLDHQIAKVEDEYGFYLTAGLQLPRGFFVEATYRDVQGSVNYTTISDIDTSTKFAIDLSGFTASLGYKFGGKK